MILLRNLMNLAPHYNSIQSYFRFSRKLNPDITLLFTQNHQFEKLLHHARALDIDISELIGSLESAENATNTIDILRKKNCSPSYPTMIDSIYYEEGVREHPRTQKLLEQHFPNASLIPCSHYKEVFNPSGQNFRLQKKKPALILAKNSGKLVHSVPPTYGIGGTRNFYFSHMLNCLYDCRYCFLQGMYPSAHYLLFVNYEDFFDEIKRTHEEDLTEPSWFFSGYDCDSLALESLTGFVSAALPYFADHPTAHLELLEPRASPQKY